MYKFRFLIGAIALVGVTPAVAVPTTRTGVPSPATPQPLTRAALLKNLEAQFKALDKNGDGVLTKDELAAAQLRSMQRQSANIRARFDADFTKFDTNHDGQLSKSEFMAAAPQAPTTLPDVTTRFGQLDKNHDGKVTMDEYQSVMLADFDSIDKQHKGTIAERGGATASRADFASKLGATFKLIDTASHGYFTKADLAAAELKIRQQRVAAVRGRMEAEFMKLDTNKDGQLSRTEFMAAAPGMPAKLPDGGALLTALDKNKDGKVTLDEYCAPILARFDALDTNHDGIISAAERQAAAAKK